MLKEMLGRRFGRLTVIREATKDDCKIGKTKKLVCVCDCGNVSFPSIYKLRDGLALSCGCLKREKLILRNTKHGKAPRGNSNRLYHIWLNMKSRCYNEKHPRFSNYGGKGIKICDSWRNDFTAFETWSLQNGYLGNLTIDRMDASRGYCPENCRWIPLEENSSCAKTPKFKSQALEDLQSGMSNREVAQKYGVHITTTIRWAHSLSLMTNTEKKHGGTQSG